MNLINSKFGEILLLLQFIQYLLFILTGNLLFFYGNSAVGAVSLFFLMNKLDKQDKQKVIFIIIFTSILFLFNSFYVGNFPFTDVVREYLSFFSTALLLYFVNYRKRMWFYFFIVVCFVFVERIIHFQGDEISIFYLGSRNYISLYLFLFILPYYYSSNRGGEVVNLLPSVVILIISIVAQGRGGMVMSAILLILTMVKNLIILPSTNKQSKRIRVISIGILITTVYVAFYTNVLEDYLVRFDVDVEDEARLVIWGDYMNSIESDFSALLFGTPLSSIPIIRQFQHLHNSYLMVHACAGLIGLLLLIIVSIKGFVQFIHSSYYDVAILLLCVYVKAFTDYCYPKQITDVFIWLVIIFLCMRYKNNVNLKTSN